MEKSSSMKEKKKQIMEYEWGQVSGQKYEN